MEQELAIFSAEMQRYEAQTKRFADDLSWRFLLGYGQRRGIVEAWEKKIKNKNKIIAKFQSSLEKLYKAKEALLKEVNEKFEAKEDDDNVVMKLKMKIWDLNDDIRIIRNKAIKKGRSMIDRKFELEAVIANNQEKIYGNPADLPPISDTDVEISDAECQVDEDALYEAKYDDVEVYEIEWRRRPLDCVKLDEAKNDDAESAGTGSSSSEEDEADDDNDEQEEIF